MQIFIHSWDPGLSFASSPVYQEAEGFRGSQLQRVFGNINFRYNAFKKDRPGRAR